MGIIAILIAISLFIALIFLLIFYWSMKSGQYDDTYTPSVRMLFDDSSPKKKLDPKEGLTSKVPHSIATKPTECK